MVEMPETTAEVPPETAPRTEETMNVADLVNSQSSTSDLPNSGVVSSGMFSLDQQTVEGGLFNQE